MCKHYHHACYDVCVTAANGVVQLQPQQQPLGDSRSSGSGSSDDSAAPEAAQLTTDSAAVDASQQLGQQVCRCVLRFR
jgi:hypothetical protein